MNELDCVSEKMWGILMRKFPHLEQSELALSVRELVRFLRLKAEGLDGFCPVSTEVDLIWHHFILETREYPAFSHAISPNAVLHHSQITLEDYDAREGSAARNDRDLSVLVSYVLSFGDFDEKAVTRWPVASWLQTSQRWSVSELNTFLRKIGRASKPASS